VFSVVIDWTSPQVPVGGGAMQSVASLDLFKEHFSEQSYKVLFVGSPKIADESRKGGME